jgi:hypothetical protein
MSSLEPESEPEPEPAAGAAHDPAAHVPDSVAQAASATPAPDPPAAQTRIVPVLSEQSPEDTDTGWGEYAGRDDDRFYRDRPPHWDHF